MGGHERVKHQIYDLERVSHDISKFYLYIPSRSAIVFELAE